MGLGFGKRLGSSENFLIGRFLLRWVMGEG